MRTLRPTIALAAVLTLAALGAPAAAQTVGIPSVPLDIHNMELVANVPNLSGNNLAFFERQEDDGSVSRYVISSTQGNGFDIVDITDPTQPATVGRYLLGEGTDTGVVEDSSLGVNYHPWVDVNPRRNIVALSIENPAGVAVRHSFQTGMQFVDISDVTNPVPLGSVEAPLNGPHTLRMIGDNHVYTSLDTFVVDYTDPQNPVGKRLPVGRAGHEFWPDPNDPASTWVGTTVPGRWEVWDTTDPEQPTLTVAHADPGGPDTVHEVYPAPDGSYIGAADFTSLGQFQTECPGGGIYFYDVSGRHVPGASLDSPRRLGTYFAPFDGAGTSVVNHVSCTMHSWQMAPEREIALGGLYTGGTWVIDPTGPTRADSDYEEYDGSRGKTTWGTTVGNVRDALDFVNATQWFPFDAASADHERLVFVTGWERGLDIYRYTGPLPKKMARLAMSSAAAGGAVTGTLDRYAVLTHEGWANLPLAERTVTVTAGDVSVDVVTAADGSFTADLGLASGTHEVTATWAGDDAFRAETVTQTVVVP